MYNSSFNTVYYTFVIVSFNCCYIGDTNNPIYTNYNISVDKLWLILLLLGINNQIKRLEIYTGNSFLNKFKKAWISQN